MTNTNKFRVFTIESFIKDILCIAKKNIQLQKHYKKLAEIFLLLQNRPRYIPRLSTVFY